MSPTGVQNNRPDSSIVIVMPVHIKKANWFAGFLHSHKMFSNLPIIAVATDEAEQIFFEDLVRIIEAPVEIICATNLLKSFIEDPNILLQSNDAIINIKKFVGIAYALGVYSYAFAFDCDSVFIGQCDWVGPAVENYDQKSFLGLETKTAHLNRNNKLSRLVIDPSQKFSLLDNVIDIYTWFMDPPLYKNQDFLDFVYYCDGLYGGWINFLRTLKYYSFEHTIYQYFLVSQKGWSIKDYSHIAPYAPEDLSLEARKKINIEFNHKPVWTSMRTCLSAPVEDRSAICLCFHVDRV